MDRLPMVPLAVLGRGSKKDRERVFKEAFHKIYKTGGERAEELLNSMNVLARVTLNRWEVKKMIDQREGPRESLVDFYQDTIIGQGLGERTRAEGLMELISARFGPDPSIPETARRLAAWPSGAFHAVCAAGSLEEVVKVEPPD